MATPDSFESQFGQLTELSAGMLVPYGGDRFIRVSDELAAAFAPGDALYVVQETGALLHVPSAVRQAVRDQVDAASAAFTVLASLPPSSIARFFDLFADGIDAAWESIQRSNDADVARARKLGRSTTRLVVSDRARQDMTEGLRGWARRMDRAGDEALSREISHVAHETWDVSMVTAPLGVIGFVFEGRPNVLADAAGVLASGNTAVLRIGGDALGTAQAIRDLALAPALDQAGLPAGALAIVPVRDRSAGWALFSDSRLALAVTRGSGRAVTELSAVARQAGVPVSAHGTGGAWLVADEDADAQRFADAIRNSLDRKVCNTVNVVAVVEDRAKELIPLALEAADSAAGKRLASEAAGEHEWAARIHVAQGSEHAVDQSEFTRQISVVRAQGEVLESRASLLDVADLGREWEWEGTPEISIIVVADIDEAINLFNAHSPHFVASLISEDEDARRRFVDLIDAPFVGDGFTRWVDGQYALDQPELGLSNWEHGRLLARGGVLTGADLTTRRLIAHHDDPDQHR